MTFLLVKDEKSHFQRLSLLVNKWRCWMILPTVAISKTKVQRCTDKGLSDCGARTTLVSFRHNIFILQVRYQRRTVLFSLEV
jgi:hypothetical protein